MKGLQHPCLRALLHVLRSPESGFGHQLVSDLAPMSSCTNTGVGPMSRATGMACQSCWEDKWVGPVVVLEQEVMIPTHHFGVWRRPISNP